MRIPAAVRDGGAAGGWDGTIAWIEGVGPAAGFAADFEAGWVLEIRICGET